LIVIATNNGEFTITFYKINRIVNKVDFTRSSNGAGKNQTQRSWKRALRLEVV